MSPAAPRRACDRCYSNKERCTWDDGSETCARCIRLHHACTISRPVQKPGRRPTADSRKSLVWIPSKLPHRQSRAQDTLGDASPIPADAQSGSSLLQNPLNETALSPTTVPEEVLVDQTSSEEHFLRYFVVGPSFTSKFAKLVRRSLFDFPDICRDATLACVGAVLRLQTGKLGLDDEGMARGSSALRTLRSSTASISTAGAFLNLGTALATFELLTLSSSAHAIVRASLTSIQPWYAALWADAEHDSELLCPIFMDTVECLVHREIPIFKYQCRDPTYVDRYVGVCATFLDTLYEVCVFGHACKESYDVPGEMGYERLAAQIRCWQPSFPADFLDIYSKQEMLALLTQARIYRLSALLILHRLRYSFGVHDEEAANLSRDILGEFSQQESLLLGHSNHVPRLLFPWTIAAIEVTDPTHRASLLSQQPNDRKEVLMLTHGKVKDFIRYVWVARDHGSPQSWFQLVDEVPPFSMTP